MVERFRIEDIGKAGARFDEDKLRWMCGEYVRRWTPEQCLLRALPWLERVVPAAAFASHAAWLRNIVACYQERIAILSDFEPKLGWLFQDLPVVDEAARKNLAKEPAAKGWLAAYADVLEAANLPPSWPQDRTAADRAVLLPTRKDAPPVAAPCTTPAQLEAECRAFTERIGVKFGTFVHPVRAALTGTDKGPGLFDVLFLLGKDACVRRLRAAAQ
jgi:glutamyl-tRNA synthetase